MGSNLSSIYNIPSNFDSRSCKQIVIYINQLNSTGIINRSFYREQFDTLTDRSSFIRHEWNCIFWTYTLLCIRLINLYRQATVKNQGRVKPEVHPVEQSVPNPVDAVRQWDGAGEQKRIATGHRPVLEDHQAMWSNISSVLLHNTPMKLDPLDVPRVWGFDRLTAFTEYCTLISLDSILNVTKKATYTTCTLVIYKYKCPYYNLSRKRTETRTILKFTWCKLLFT